MQLSPEQLKFKKQVQSPLFRLFMFVKLPAAYFAGVRLKKMDDEECVVTIPYKWASQNPFKSTYFACLAMAGEMSTGLPGMLGVWKQKPGISMLVVKLESQFTKKANNLTSFVCKDVKAVFDTIEKCKETGNGETIQTTSIGYDKYGDEVARFWITWSFKQKQKK